MNMRPEGKQGRRSAAKSIGNLQRVSYLCFISLLIVSAAFLPHRLALGKEESAGSGDAEDSSIFLAESSVSDLTSLSIEELLQVKVATPARKEERLWSSDSAVYVITAEDIARSPARTLPDLLRTVPGVHVALLNNGTWSVTLRGFGGVYSNKLLVMVDGRTVYTPLYAGTLWDFQDLPLEEIERIEIVRGPKASAWGSNAVNGVIHIITKSTADTQGGLLRVEAGNELRGRSYFRYGGTFGEDWRYRVWGEWSDWDELTTFRGDDGGDFWRERRLGLRVDWNAPGGQDNLTIASSLVESNPNSPLIGAYPRLQSRKVLQTREEHTDGYVLTRWQHRFSEDSVMNLQLSYERFNFGGPLLGVEQRNSYELSYDHTLKMGDRHTFTYGVNYLYTEDYVAGTELLRMSPKERELYRLGLFLQDTISFADDRVRLTLGTKIEQADYGGFNPQPTVRLAYLPNEKLTTWVAVSRAVRLPSRSERDIELAAMGAPFVLAVLTGNPAFDEEKVWTAELGFRYAPSSRFAFAVTPFISWYDDLRTLEAEGIGLGWRPLPPHLVIPLLAENHGEAQTYGLEVIFLYQPRSWWTIQGNYSYLNVDLDLHVRTVDLITRTTEGDAPTHMLSLTQHWNVTKRVQLSLTGRYVDDLPSLGVPAYFEVDAWLRWKVKENLQLGIGGMNLLQPSHKELAPSLVPSVPSEVQRNVFASVTWTF
jgi:iron complex outermembrane receptor protein